MAAKSEGHNHDTDGKTENASITIGDELVGYTKVYCTCGALIENNVTSRTHIAPRTSPENKK